ncbi:hypothetical protein K438DRAFT_1810574, partial [Mycena galopus ATCC 62051]
VYTDDTGTNLTDRDHLCFTCCATDERTWRRRSDRVREKQAQVRRLSSSFLLLCESSDTAPTAAGTRRGSSLLFRLNTSPYATLTMTGAFSCASFVLAEAEIPFFWFQGRGVYWHRFSSSRLLPSSSSRWHSRLLIGP